MIRDHSTPRALVYRLQMNSGESRFFMMNTSPADRVTFYESYSEVTENPPCIQENRRLWKNPAA